jgi:hypothetical protein
MRDAGGRWRNRDLVLVLVVGGETEMTFSFPLSPVETLHLVLGKF